MHAGIKRVPARKKIVLSLFWELETLELETGELRTLEPGKGPETVVWSNTSYWVIWTSN